MTNPASYTIFMSRSFFRSASLVVAALAMFGCGDDPVDTPTTPTPQPVTETFTGRLTVNGGVTHPFSASTAGSLTATLTNITPEENPTVGLSLGTWNGAACAVVISTDAAVRTTVVYGTVNQAGQLCVRIYDVGRLATANDYEITVVHP
jgi:hypothetical protein